MNKFKRTLVTAALPYANGPVHIGHLAGCYLPADIFVRYQRLNGKDIKFICGSDEHGVPITIKAKKESTSPRQVVDKYHKIMADAFVEFGISFDIYSRTTSAIHHQTASDFFKTLYKKGSFIEKITEQYYDEEAKQFLADRYITGTCPKCGHENAYGDQCEKCGSSLNPTDLINPKSTLSGSKPILKQTKNWFLPLDKLQPKIEEYIEKHKDWKPNVYGQCKSWLESGEGLQPRAMTRDLDWGVPVPVDGAEGKVLYVWFDAPIGYISATKELLPDQWQEYWQREDSRIIHFIGKDNIVFHCIIFPAMLIEHGKFVLPDNVPANEFLNLEGEKISTSRNWAVWLHEYLQDFKGKQDTLRYVLCANAPETKDNDFTWKEFQTRNNSELVAILGNFVNRTLVLTQKYFENKVPKAEVFTKEDLSILKEIEGNPQTVAQSLDNFKFREGLANMMNLARIGNKYLADTEPWKLINTNPERVKTILNISLQICASLTVTMKPFMPFTAGKLENLLNLKNLHWSDAGKTNNLPDGHQLNNPELLFSKIEDAEIETQLKKLSESKKNSEIHQSKINPAKTPINFDDFSKLDIRIGTILKATKVPKADKLLQLTIDTGIDKRTVISGIAEYYKPEEIIGQQVSILVNLAPRKIKGIESNGMILMAEQPDGRLCFVQPKDAVVNGSIVR